ncbi:MAG: NAD-dependent epimerase/dehydratase family protein [Azospirillaceae bacterium]|nr:NAD-dependent epimerase/dehydratase family protein [Azospirillaceae bacterium]
MTAAPIVAITGATGFLGGHLVQILADSGVQLRVLARRPPDPATWAGLPVDVVQGGLEDAGALARLTDGVDALVHAAGLIKARDRAAFLRTNRDGAGAVATCLRRQAPAAPFILVSSLAAREPQLSDYAASKRAGEEEVRRVYADAPEQLTIVRPPMIYGPGDRETLAIFQAAGRPLAPLVGTGRLAAIHVTDAAAALVAVTGAGLRGPTGGTYALADTNPAGYAMADMMREAARAMGHTAPPRLWAIPGPLLLAAGTLSARWGALRGTAPIFTDGKAREILHPDWTVAPGELLPARIHASRIGLAEGFRETVAWYRAAGWLT